MHASNGRHHVGADLADDSAVRLLHPDLRLHQSLRLVAGLPGNLFATQRISSYASLIKDRPLAEKVADDLGGSISPDDLRDEVTATVDPDTVILQITATDPDPVLARDIAQAYAEQLKNLVTQLETPDNKNVPLVKASIVDNAQVSDMPVSPRPVRNLALASCSACCSASEWPCCASCLTPHSQMPRTSPK